jgi:glucose-6-phosphate isomerase
MAPITTLPEWDALDEHAASLDRVHLRELFAGDPTRAERLTCEAAGWYVDFSKHRATDETLRLLEALARARDVPGRLAAQLAGEAVNTTEGRPALHTALRAPEGTVVKVDGVDVVRLVHGVLRRMAAFADAVRSGEWRGHTGRPIRAVVNIGIGGSDLGPAMAYEALRAFCVRDLTVRFVSNVDGADLAGALADLDPGETLFVVASKTFTTLETITNARSARDWLVAALGEDAVSRHFVAVSTNAREVERFGIDTTNMFEFWDWVGGRYSVWSAIGLPLMVAIGPEHFRALLAGAHAMDEHVRTAGLHENVPVRMALLSLWYRSFFDAQTHAVVPYAHVLGRLPAYLQQLEMESLGKHVGDDGSPVGVPTGAVVWGTPGTNGQHAYFQLLHQGTTLVAVDLVGACRPQPGLALPGHQDLLVANLLGQAEALAFGRTRAEVEADGTDPVLASHKVMPGNRPSTVFLCEQLDPFALGALVAAYEHKVAALGALWGIDAFDQWGVELGKQLATRIVPELAPGGPPPAHDSSTNALILRYRSATSGSPSSP